MTCKYSALFSMALAFSGNAAFAQSVPLPSFELERLELNPSAVDSLVVGSGALLAPGAMRFSLAGHYQRNPLVVYRDEERLGALVRNRVTLHVLAALAVHERLELGVQVPVVLGQRGDDLTGAGLSAPSTDGVGTTLVSARVGLLRTVDDAPLDLSAQLGVGLPIGRDSAFASDRRVSFLPRLYASRRFSAVALSGEAGYLERPETSLGVEEVGDEVRLGAAASTTGHVVRAEVSFRSGVSLSGLPTASELLGGVRLMSAFGLEGFALAGPGFGETPGSPTARAIIGVAYQPLQGPVCRAGVAHAPAACPDLDLDADGRVNRLDRCPDRPEDRDGFQDSDGCPDLDNDADGIPDGVDRCRDEKGELAFDGCPPPDGDRDGVLDAEDACPAEPGSVERKGCPFKDADGDGIEDAVDACPQEAGTPELKGCPVRDADGDGVPDHLDNCPQEPGPEANRGCKKKQWVEITRERLVIKDKVYFATGKAKILPRSYGLLDQVANVINGHPEIGAIVVEGHTDSRGNPDTNLELSQKRAEAVRDYLTSQRVEGARLSARGYGSERPAAPNTSA
ncbi:MAG TPA: OmpA family protein, partial [Myxococcaceae bacterium]|nr:OmpA family protein [Myxococcaceae bacterium]